MLTGRHPFGATGLVEMLLHQLRDDLPSIADFKADLPDELDAIIQKATAKSPDDRFSDALALTEALRNVIDPKPVQNFLSPTATLTQSVKAAGDLSARIYTKSGAVLENPRYLIGREKLISKVSELLEANTHILLHGMAGIGKTVIAGTIAAKFLDAHADKQIIWIELGRQDADAFFEAVAQASGKFQAIAVTSGDERITTMRNILLETDSLLVIDNIWNESAILPIIRAIPHTMPFIDDLTNCHVG